jgi:hypothetical protein
LGKILDNGKIQESWLKGKVCRACGIDLSMENIPTSKLKRREAVCIECHSEMLKGLPHVPYVPILDKPNYVVKRRGEIGVPKIVLKDNISEDKLLFDMIEDTEQFRVNSMVRLMGKEHDPKALRQIIVYLLGSWEWLDSLQTTRVVNAANKFTGTTSHDSDLRVKMANDLRVFIKRSSANKDFQQSFEQIRSSAKEIEVETRT